MNFPPKVNLHVFLCVNVSLWSRDMSRNQKLKMKELANWRRIYLVLINKFGISERGF